MGSFFKIVSVMILFGSIVLLAATNEPPTPLDLGYEPPSFPDSVVAVTNETGAVSLYTKIDPKTWSLSFVWVGDLNDLGTTNETIYPIEIIVPFQHDQGFVFIRGEVR